MYILKINYTVFSDMYYDEMLISICPPPVNKQKIENRKLN